MLQLTQEETAERLHVSRSTVQRSQREAVHTLARRLWQISKKKTPTTTDPLPATDSGGLISQDLAWEQQFKRELRALRASSDHVADVADVINNILELGSVLTSGHNVSLQVGSVQHGVVAAVPPELLQQIIITSLRQLIRDSEPGPITLFARYENGKARITMTSRIGNADTIDTDDFRRGLVRAGDVSVETHLADNRLFLWLELPTSEGTKVLVIDDNPDMVTFYARATEGTRYHILHTASGENLFDIIEETTPDIIILDVMLPGIDGWRLLMRLHETPRTRAIPVIICSVVREPELARDLGAALYLPKPVRPRALIQALDQAASRASEEVTTPPVNSPLRP